MRKDRSVNVIAFRDLLMSCKQKIEVLKKSTMLEKKVGGGAQLGSWKSVSKLCVTARELDVIVYDDL